METNIVVLDSVPLDKGDLDWAPLRELGHVTLYPDTPPELVLDRIRDARIVFSNKVKIPGDDFDCAPGPRLVCVTATGYDVIDIHGARRNGVVVSNVPSYSAYFTAQTAIALLLELTHHIGEHDRAVRVGQWQSEGTFSFWNYPLVELHQKTMLILGLGSIGSRVARIAEAIGMNVIAAALPGRDYDAANEGPYPRLALADALPVADVISLHCPLRPETREIINKTTIALMKPSVLLVNTARGLLVDEAAMAAALHESRVAGYAGDVLSVEPAEPTNPLLHAPRCIISPHLSWASLECRQRLLHVSTENARAFLNGTPQNVVS